MNESIIESFAADLAKIKGYKYYRTNYEELISYMQESEKARYIHCNLDIKFKYWDIDRQRHIKILHILILLAPQCSYPYKKMGELMHSLGIKTKPARCYALFHIYNNSYRVHTFKNISSDILLKESNLIHIDEISELLCNLDSKYDFIPSYQSMGANKFSHLMHVHIPKTGGTTLGNSLYELINSMNNNMSVKDYLSRNSDSYCFLYDEFWVNEAHSHGLEEYIKTLKCKKPPLFSFLRPHSAMYENIAITIKKVFNIDPVKVAVYRDPIERLISYINHYYSRGANYEDLRQELINKGKGVDNNIFRHVYDDFLFDQVNERSGSQKVDILINIKNAHLLNHIRTLFLSSSQLPNLICLKRLNEGSKDRFIDKTQKEELLNIAKEKKLLQMDSNLNYFRFTEKQQDIDKFYDVEDTKKLLHPLTYICSPTGHGMGSFIETKTLVQNLMNNG